MGARRDHARMQRTVLRLLLVVVALTAAACGGQTATPPPSGVGPPTTPTAIPAGTGSGTGVATPSAAATPTQSAPADTVWLCRPGLANNPCAGDLSATAISADGSTSLEPAAPAQDPPIDCFYIYPTVSRQKGTNATLKIEPEERAVALAQAARFSQICNVYAPMYPQLTDAAIARPESIPIAGALAAYQGVWSAFLDYMANYNHGRGIVFMGHSQGAYMLTALLKAEVDPKPETRRLLVSALLLGGNVAVPIGKSVGGDFANIPACGSTTQIGCVVAYSSFATTPPADALFGRVNSALNPFGRDSSGSLQVLCVNPAAPAGGSAALTPYLPTQGLAALLGANAQTQSISVKTPFVTYPGEFSAHCQTAGGATWLQIDRTKNPADRRPGLSNVGSARWGLHVVDVNIALGDLVDLVRSEAAAYRA
jgi:hypothetical protein